MARDLASRADAIPTAASWLPDDEADEVQRIEVEHPDGKRESFWPESAESLAAEGKVKIVAADVDRLRAWRDAIDARNRRDKPPTNARAAFADVRPYFANRELYRTTTRRHLRDRPQYRRASRPGRPPGRRVARAGSRGDPPPPGEPDPDPISTAWHGFAVANIRLRAHLQRRDAKKAAA